MPSLRASARGLEVVDKARKKKGWTRTVTVAWWEDALTTQATLKRFWRKQPIQQESFVKICQVVGINNWKQIADSSATEAPEEREMSLIDWGEAPAVWSFYGRTQELAKLEKWIVVERCRLVTLSGMPGIGKTALAATLADGIQDKFKYIIWRSLRYAPPIQDLLTDLLRFFDQQQETNLPQDTSRQVTKLIEYLTSNRCLLILDEVETILGIGQLAGQYREGYEDYGELIRRVAEGRHQSCLLLTTREKLRKIHLLEGESLPVRSLELTGLQEEEALEIFREKGLSDPDKWRQIIQTYHTTNPLVLKIIAAAIKESFNGRVTDFLKHKSMYLGEISNILDPQFERLSELEKEIMYRLAINGKPLSRFQLREEVGLQVSESELTYALESLGRRSLIEKIPEESELIFTLQPVVMKYVNKRLNR
jgi:hypothetical protein